MHDAMLDKPPGASGSLVTPSCPWDYHIRRTSFPTISGLFYLPLISKNGEESISDENC